METCIKLHLYPAWYISFILGAYTKQLWEAMKNSQRHGDLPVIFQPKFYDSLSTSLPVFKVTKERSL